MNNKNISQKTSKTRTFVGKASNWFDTWLSPKMEKIANQRHLVAIRNGIVSTIPFVIVGSIMLILLNFPLSSTPGDNLGAIMPPQLNKFVLAIFRFSMGAMGLYAAFGISSNLGKHYGFGQSITGMIGVFGYLMWFDFQTLTVSGLGASTIFNAMISGIIGVEIYRLVVRFKLTIRLPKAVPAAISESFLVITPILIIGLLFGTFRFILNFDINTFLNIALAPLQNVLTGGIGGVILIILLVTFFWSFGIHGVSIVGSVVRPFWQIAIAENGEWWSGGMIGPVPHEFPEQFLQWTVWIGGSGATIGLVTAGSFLSKSKQGKAISRSSLIPGIFNINEPAIFGYPIMLTPILIVPFVIGPIIMAIVAWLMQSAMDVYWVTQAPWTLPGPAGAYFASGANWRAIIIALVCTGISILVWIPFYLKWDRDLLKKEQAKLKVSVKNLKIVDKTKVVAKLT